MDISEVELALDRYKGDLIDKQYAIDVIKMWSDGRLSDYYAARAFEDQRAEPMQMLMKQIEAMSEIVAIAPKLRTLMVLMMRFLMNPNEITVKNIQEIIEGELKED